MKLIQGCASGVILSLLCGLQAHATTPAFGLWDASAGAIVDGSATTDENGVVCPSGFTCSEPLTGAGFFQRQVMEEEGNYFQTIITEIGVSETITPAAPDSDLTAYDKVFLFDLLFNFDVNLCPPEHHCGDRISQPAIHRLSDGQVLLDLARTDEQEFTDGTMIGIQTIQPGQLYAETQTTYIHWDQTPFHFFNAAEGQELSPGQYVTSAMIGDPNRLLKLSRMIADLRKLPISILFRIPNQCAV